MFSIRFNRWTIAALAITALAVPGSLAAQTPDHPADNSAQFPTSHDLKSLTMSGSYLAARHASVERDAASAAAFYRSALRTDPKNNELLDRAFISSLADGDIDEAVKLADRILTIDKSNRVARLVVGVRDLKLKKYASRAAQHQSVDPRTDHRSGGDAAVGLGQLRRRRQQGGGRQHRQADRPGMVSDLQGSALRHDPRTRRARKRTPARASSGPTSSTIRCCASPTPMRAGCRATRMSRRRRRSTRPSTRSCRGIRWCRKACARPRPARSCRRWSIPRRPAPPRRCTASAQR